MSIKTKCSRCSQFFGAPDQTLGKVAKCPYCGAQNDIIDLNNDDDELAALIEEERKKTSGGKAATAFSDPTRSSGAPIRAAPAKSQNWRQAPAPKKADSQIGMFDLSVGQMLAVAIGVLGTGELIASLTMSSSDHVVNALFGMVGWLFGWGAWREYQTRKRNPGSVQLWQTIEFWVGIVLAGVLALWATISFAMPAFPVISGGFSHGFGSHVVVYLAEMILLWLVLLGFGVGLFVMGGQQKVFTLAAWLYLLVCVLTLVCLTPFAECVGNVSNYAQKEPQTIFAVNPQAPPAAVANNNVPPVNNAQPNRPEGNPPPAASVTPPGAPADVAAQQPNVQPQQPPQPETPAQPSATPEQPASTEKALPQIAWQATADPNAKAEARPWIRQPAIPLQSSVDLAWPTTIAPIVAVLNRNQGEPSAELWDLSTACSKAIIHGSFDFKETILLSPEGKYLAGVGEFGIEIWSFETGKLLARLPIDRHNGDVLVDFLPDDSIVTLGNTPGKGAELKIWSFGGDPKLKKIDLPDNVVVNNKAATVSPGRHYLATFGMGAVWIVDLQKGELCGMIPVFKPEDQQANNNSEVELSFSSDGQELTGLFGNGQTLHLMAWSMKDGSPSANFELSETINNRDKGRVLECFPDNQAWLVDGRLVVDRTGQAWPILKHDIRILGLSDNDHLVVANEQTLSTWKLPRQSDGRLKLATLEIQHEDLPVVMVSHDVAPLTADLYNRASRRYRSQIEVDILAADDATLVQTLRWCPVLKQPFFGVRWGIGIQTQMSTAAAGGNSGGTTGRIEEQAGALGTALTAELQRRIDAGAFGQDPQVGDPRFSSVVFLGSGTQKELLSNAKAMGLSALVLLQIPQALPGQPAPTGGQVKIHVIDVSGKTQWERTAPNAAPGTGSAEVDPDELAAVAADVGKYLDDNYVLQPMPEMQAKDVPARVKQLVGEAHDDPLAVFGELRYDQIKGLLSADEALAAFKKWLSDERAQVMANGTPAQRRAMLELWVKSSRS